MHKTLFSLVFVLATVTASATGWRADFSAGLPKGASWWSINRKANQCSIAPWVNPYDGRGMLKAHWDGVGNWMHVYFQTPRNTFPKMERFIVRAVVKPMENADGAVRRLNLFLTDSSGMRNYFDRDVRWAGCARRTLTWVIESDNMNARTPNGKRSNALTYPLVDIGLNFLFFEGAQPCDLIVESLTVEAVPPIDPSAFGTYTYADVLDLPNRKMIAPHGGPVACVTNSATSRAAIRCSPAGRQNLFGVDFARGGSPMGVLAPKFPLFDSAVLTVDVTTDGKAPLDGLALAYVDGSSTIQTLKVPCAALATAGHHAVDVNLSGRAKRPFVLRGIFFTCAAGAKGATAYVNGVSLRTRARMAEVLRLELDTGADFNHSVPVGRSSVTARLVNPTRERVAAMAHLALYDWRDMPCGWQIDQPVVLEGGATARFEVPVPKQEGVFYVRGTLKGSDCAVADATSVERSFASFRPTGQSPRLVDDGDFRFGTVAHLNPYFGCDAEMTRCADAMAYVGLKVLRTNLFPWSDYDCAQYDKMVALFQSRGIDIDFILPEASSPATGEPYWERLAAAYEKSFRRWKGRVAYWELLNEPDLSWGREHPTTAAHYAELSRRTLKILRATDPTASYMSGGFCTFDEKKLGPFQEEAMKVGKDVFDLHCFHGHGTFEHYRRIIEGMFLPLREKLGVKIPWYANETAINASCGQSEKLQAETLYKKVLYSWAHGAKGLTWYNLRGKGENPNEGEHGFGMLTFDMYPRAVYGAWNGLTRLYGGRRFACELRMGAHAWGFVFAKGGENAACLWTSPGKRRTIRLRTTAAHVTKVDLFGNRQDVPLSNGCFDLVIEEEPVNLVYEGELFTEDSFISPAGVPPNGRTAAVFQRGFTNRAAVVAAIWRTTALGVYDCTVNGKPVGTDFLKPGYTECGKCRHEYSYDVLPLLNVAAGASNALAATVTPGWWCDQLILPPPNVSLPWQIGQKVAFRGVLQLKYADGREETIASDDRWGAAYSGPLCVAGIYEGEEYDATAVVCDMKPAVRNDEFRGEIRPAAARIALRHDLTLKPVVGFRGELKPGEMMVIDFGQNCAAVPLFTVEGAAGTHLEMRFAEMLNEPNGDRARGNDGPGGTPYLANLRKAYAGLKYTLREGRQTYQPAFTYYGYRYVGITTTAPVRFHSFVSIPVSSVTPAMEVGRIATGNDRVNRLISNILWGLRSNYLSIPTDCPQRDERFGWTADTQVFVESAGYLTDSYAFLMKYLDDLADVQRAVGAYPQFAPNCRHRFDDRASAGWSDAGVMIPYRLWKRYGRTEPITRYWRGMLRYMDHLAAHGGHDTSMNGDWLSLEHLPKPKAQTQDEPYRWCLAAIYYIWDATLMREMASTIQDGVAEKRFATLEATLRKNFAAKFLQADGTLLDVHKSQTMDLLMLKHGLCATAEATEKTRQDLLARIRDSGNTLQTGFLGTSVLMPVLTEQAKAPDMAYTLLLQDKFPSWLYSVDQGATTVWERWNSYTKEKGFGPATMNSFNHYAYGCVMEWLFAYAAGIRADPKQPGYRHFILAPVTDRRLGSLTAEYASPAGCIKSAWHYAQDGKLHWSFTIPAGTTATVTPPNGASSRDYAAGTYSLEL